MSTKIYNYFTDTATMRKLLKIAKGMLALHQATEEPCKVKVLRTVLETNGSREGLVEFNTADRWWLRFILHQ